MSLTFGATVPVVVKCEGECRCHELYAALGDVGIPIWRSSVMRAASHHSNLLVDLHIAEILAHYLRDPAAFGNITPKELAQTLAPAFASPREVYMKTGAGKTPPF